MKMKKKQKFQNKIMKMYRIGILILLLFLQQGTVAAQAEGGDFMRNMGKMYVVVAVISVVFIGIILYLLKLERKINKIEKENRHE